MSKGTKNDRTTKDRPGADAPDTGSSVPGLARPHGPRRERPVGNLPLGIELVDYDQKAGIVYAAIHLDRAENDLRILTSLVNSLNSTK